MSENKTRERMFGRAVITSSVESVDRSNVVDVLKKALTVHSVNQADIEYLWNYIKGDQPILYRVKEIRPEICNRRVENHALEIVEFKTGYVFSEPIQYVRHSEKSNLSVKPKSDEPQDEITLAITKLNDYMSLASKAKFDASIGRWQNTCGTAFRMTLPNKDFDKTDKNSRPFKIDVLDPRYAFVVYSTGFGSEALMGVKFVKNAEDKFVYSVYTTTRYYEIVEDDIVKDEPHVLNDIPIIEYPANQDRLGAFEVVLGLLDALNDTLSNRMDGIEQFIQSFMKFINCEIDKDGMDNVKALGAVMAKQLEAGFPVDIGMIETKLDQEQTQITKTDIYQMVLIICGMPDRNGSNRTTGDTGKAVILRDGWGAAEARAKLTELAFNDAEKKFLRIILRILRDLTDIDLGLTTIDIKFTRNRTDNLIVKTQGLQNMLEAGIHPRIALSTCELFSDPEQVFSDSEPYLKKWIEAVAGYTPGNNKSTDINTEVN